MDVNIHDAASAFEIPLQIHCHRHQYGEGQWAEGAWQGTLLRPLSFIVILPEDFRGLLEEGWGGLTGRLD